MSGPTQLLVVGFGGSAAFEGRILEEIDRLQGRGMLRLLDALFVTKNEDGTMTRLAIGDDDLGELIVSVVPLEATGLFGLLAGNDVSGPDIADANTLAESLTPGDALAFLLVEHRWARPLFDAIADTGGTILGEGFITNEAEILVGAEVAAMDEAARVIATAQVVEAEAAAVDSIRALIEAGLIEEAAFHEAADALVAAGVIVEAAERTSAEAASAASVTQGEIRVLRYLATGIRFAVVADKLGISRSAAKERAERAYKKLGVHNSADAVARAKELGLIPKSS